MPEAANLSKLGLPKPEWIKVPAPGRAAEEVSRLVRDLSLHTVCEEAACPNRGGCWAVRHAAFMILGHVCTRACAFCNVATGRGSPVDEGEPQRLAEAAAKMNLSHVVITSVDRDDLADGGATQFARCIAALREKLPAATVEVLTPDFLNKPGALEIVLEAGPDVFNHNLETVPRLYAQMRRGAKYETSLRLLADAKKFRPEVFTKSGIMVGLGETLEEVTEVMDALRESNVEFITIGQYLRPTPNHAPVARYWTPEEFENLAKLAREKGFLHVASSPLTRSSHHAGEDFQALKAARK